MAIYSDYAPCCKAHSDSSFPEPIGTLKRPSSDGIDMPRWTGAAIRECVSGPAPSDRGTIRLQTLLGSWTASPLCPDLWRGRSPGKPRPRSDAPAVSVTNSNATAPTTQAPIM